MDTTLTIFIILFGLVIGSFLSVCIYRLPIGRFDALDDDGEAIPSNKEKLSIFYPARSFCPSCQNQLKWYHNIPLFSWIFLGGKCAFCKTKIPFRYPLIEIISACFAFLSFYYYGITLEGFIIYAFCASLIVMSFIDIDYFILPNIITYPISIIGIILISFNQFFHFLNVPFCQNLTDLGLGLLGALSLYLVAEFHAFIRKKEGLGFGDIKLLIMIGVFFGWIASFYTIFIGSLLAIVCTITLAICKKNSLSNPLPFGPYLSLGLVSYLFYFIFNSFY